MCNYIEYPLCNYQRAWYRGIKRARSKFIFRISSLCKVGLSAHEICIESSCKGHHDNCPDKYLIYIHRTYGMRFLFFFRGQSDWLSMRSEFSYLFPQATVALSWVAEYIPTFVTIFHKYISFFRLGSNFKQRRRSLPQADK